MKNIKLFFTKLLVFILKMMGYKKVHFLHIGKTGGSAIRNTFSESAKLNGNMVISKPFIFEMHGHGFKFKNASEDDLVFFVVRDPISRFVSAFYSRKREGQPKNYNPWTNEESIAFNIFQTPNELGLALSSEDVELKEKAIAAMKSIGHVKDSYWNWFHNEEYLLKNSKRILGFLLQENLTSDFESFRVKHKIKVSSIVNDEVKSHKNPSTSDTKLSDGAYENLKNWYAEDYRFLSIIKTLPLYN